jgi:hypothetical protein
MTWLFLVMAVASAEVPTKMGMGQNCAANQRIS